MVSIAADNKKIKIKKKVIYLFSGSSTKKMYTSRLALLNNILEEKPREVLIPKGKLKKKFHEENSHTFSATRSSGLTKVFLKEQQYAPVNNE